MNPPVNPIATIIIPIAPYHRDIAQRAITSAEMQTVPVRVLHMVNEGSPARVRNLPLNPTLNINSPFLVFLDADDALEPTFVEDCLKVYQEGKYVYTAWKAGEFYQRPSMCPDFEKTHIVTTLYPTAIFKQLQGMDDTLPGHEDVDFYLLSMREGVCGIYLDKPLVLRPDEKSGRRSDQFHALKDFEEIKRKVVERNGGRKTIMACCGNGGTPPPSDPGAKMPGDVLAVTLWSGMRSENGRVTQRMYIGGNGMKLYVAPEDVKAAPELFRIVQDLSQLSPDRASVLRDAGIL